MAALTITLTGTCAQNGGAGNHLQFSVSGAHVLTLNAEIAEMTEPISREDVLAFARCVVRLAKIGRTNAQLRTLLQNGLTVTV